MTLFNIFSNKNINQGVQSFKETEGALLIDVRTREEYASGHVDGSISLPLDEISEIGKLVGSKSTHLFIYCRSGRRSARATAYLKGHGYVNVHDIGGIEDYKGEVV